MPRRAVVPDAARGRIRTPEWIKGPDGFVAFNRICSEFQKDPPPTPLMDDMARYLQHGPRKRCLLAFRGASKSTTLARYVCWRYLCNPQRRIVVASKTGQFAKKWSKMVLDMLYGMPMLKHLAPRENQRESVLAFDVSEATKSIHPSMSAFGIGGQTTGARAHDLILDDVETPENTRTARARDELSEQTIEVQNLSIPEDLPTITYVGTPHCDETIYAKLVPRGYDIRAYPICYPTDKELEILKPYLAPMILEAIERDPGLATRPTEPNRYGDKEINDRKKEGYSNYLRQSMLLFRLPEQWHRPLRLSDLIVMSLDSELGPERVVWSHEPGNILNDLPTVGVWGDRFYGPMESFKLRPYTGCVMAIDPAGKSLGGDELAYAVVACINSQLFLLDSGGFSDGYEERNLVALAQKAVRYRVNTIYTEENFGMGMLNNLFFPILKRECERTGWACGFAEKGFRRSYRKAKHIADILEPTMNQHRLIVSREVIERDFQTNKPGYGFEEAQEFQLFYQMTRLDPDDDEALKHDDRLDALAMACSYWAPAMGLDPGSQAARASEREIEWERNRLYRFQLRGGEDPAPSPSGISWVQAIRHAQMNPLNRQRP